MLLDSEYSGCVTEVVVGVVGVTVPAVGEASGVSELSELDEEAGNDEVDDDDCFTTLNARCVLCEELLLDLVLVGGRSVVMQTSPLLLLTSGLLYEVEAGNGM